MFGLASDSHRKKKGSSSTALKKPSTSLGGSKRSLIVPSSTSELLPYVSSALDLAEQRIGDRASLHRVSVVRRPASTGAPTSTSRKSSGSRTPDGESDPGKKVSVAGVRKTHPNLSSALCKDNSILLLQANRL